MTPYVLIEIDSSGAVYCEIGLCCITIPGIGADADDALAEALASAEELFASGCDCAGVDPSILYN